MGGGSAPPAPDYASAARETAAGNDRLNTAQTYANRPNITTPWGNLTWTTGQGTDPTTGENVTTWNSNMSLTPAQQSALDSQQQIQQGRSNAAEGLLNQATQQFNTPINYDNMPARANNVTPGQLSTNFRTGFDTAGTRAGQLPEFDLNSIRTRGPDSTAQGINRSVNMFGFGPVSGAQARDVASGVGTERVSIRGVQGSIADAGDIQTRLQNDAGAVRSQAQNAVWDLQRPMLDQDRNARENQLANMGLARGSEAWNNEMRNVDDARARAQLQAISVGRDEAGQMFNQQLQGGQFANSAQALRFGQNMSQADLYNRANQQGFTQDLMASGQNFGQNLSNANLFNASQQQRFGQEMGLQGQNFQNALAASQFANQAQQQGWNQEMGAFQFGNNAQNQQFNQANTWMNTNNAAAAQNFNQNMAAAGFANNAIGQGNNAIVAQNQADIMAGNFNNQNRQGAITEAYQQRTQPLNELNALLTGQQVNQPGFQNFTQAGRAQGADLMGATSNQYNAMMNQSNFDQAQSNQQTQAAMSAAMMYAMYMWSDARLKEDIQTVGILSSGVRVVHYRYRGLPGRHLGVIAQELALVQPDAVALHPSGYLVVDYSKVF